jgi:hypothetical protein
MLNTGSNYDSIPTIEAISTYAVSNGATTQTADFRNLGILQPIQIVDGGINYSNSNTISIIGGTGYGAYANIVVNTAGSIISANYVYSASNTIQNYPLGGLGYSGASLPTVNVNSTTGSNASLSVTGIMGFGATFSPSTDFIGSISSIIINNSGSDYISTPNVSLKVADVAVSNVSLLSIPVSGDIVYQNDSSNATVFTAYVDSVTKLTTAAPYNPLNDVYRIRTYNYTGVFNQSLNVRVNSSLTSRLIPQTYYLDSVGSPTSIKTYGDGKALATAGFVGGIITGQGKYLNDDGQISTYGLVLESKDYNNYTYVLSTEQAIKTYKDLVLNLLHPSGMRLRGRNLVKTGGSFHSSVTDNFQKGNTLAYVAGSAAVATLNSTSLQVQAASANANSYLTYMVASGTGANIKLNITTSLSGSNNIIKLTNVIAGNIGNTIFANDWIKFTAPNKINAYSIITEVDWQSNTIYMADNVFLTFANVAYVSSEANSNVINITGMTGQYDGNFIDKTSSNNIISVGDRVSFNGAPYLTVTRVFANGNFSVDGFANPKLATAGIPLTILQAYTGSNATSVMRFSYTKVEGAFGNTTYSTASIPAGTIILRSLADTNNVGYYSDDPLSSADALDYNKWIANNPTLSVNARAWIENVMNPFMIANQLTYRDYIYGGETANATLTINKNAETQSVMIYGDVGLYEYPQLTTEDGYSLMTESGDYILIG